MRQENLSRGKPQIPHFTAALSQGDVNTITANNTHPKAITSPATQPDERFHQLKPTKSGTLNHR
jgi:hypothetical protein